MSVDEAKPEMGVLTDHDGKRSNIRVLSVSKYVYWWCTCFSPVVGCARNRLSNYCLYSCLEVRV